MPAFYSICFISITEGQCVCSGGQMEVAYFGQKFKFTISIVTAIRCHPEVFQIDVKHSANPQTSGIDDLSTSLNELNIQRTSREECVLKDGSFKDNQPLSESFVCSTPRKDSESFVCSTPRKDTTKDSFSERLTPDRVNVLNKSFEIQQTPERTITIDREYFQTPNIDKSANNAEKLKLQFYKITSKTKFTIRTEEEEIVEGDVSRKECVSLDNIGGLSKQISILKEMIYMPLESPHLFENYGK